MIKKFITWYANRRAPDTLEVNEYTWKLFRIGRFKFNLCYVIQSDEFDDFRPPSNPVLWLVLHGKVTMRHVVFKFNQRRYINQTDLDPFDTFILRPSGLFNTRLDAVPNNIDLHPFRFDWMGDTQVQSSDERPVWILVVSKND